MDILIHFRTGSCHNLYAKLRNIFPDLQSPDICPISQHFCCFSMNLKMTPPAYLEDGVLQTDSVKLRQHYMNSTTFYIDLLCLLPLDFLYLSLEFQSMLRVCRLVKIYRFWEFLDRSLISLMFLRHIYRNILHTSGLFYQRHGTTENKLASSKMRKLKS